MSCCSKNCLQRSLRDKIEALRSEMYVEGSVYHRKHRQLDVHKQIHRDADGRDMITLEHMEVLPKLGPLSWGFTDHHFIDTRQMH